MTREPMIHIMWNGQETVDAIPEQLQKAEQIDIVSPDDFHHALWRRRSLDASGAELEG